MRILFLAFVGYTYPHIFTKVKQQFSALRKHNPDSHCWVIGQRLSRFKNDVRGMHVVEMNLDRAAFFAAATNIAEKVRPDIVFFRYPNFDRLALDFAQRFPTVFEHHTRESSELEGEMRENDLRFGPQILGNSRGIVAVTPEILEYQQGRSNQVRPGLVLPNGIDLNACEMLHPDLDPNQVHLLFAAHFAPWHGLDRLLVGMMSYDGEIPVVLHIAGNTDCIALDRFDLTQIPPNCRVVFHGFQPADALSRIAATCHAAIGSLAIHRNGLREVASLKNRQYCLQGIPFILAGGDPDFPGDLPFVHKVPLSNAPLDINELARFALKAGSSMQLRKQIREYALRTLGWDSKMGVLAEFLQHEVEIPPRKEGAFSAVQEDTSPQVGIVIPCYNQAHLLPYAVKSLARQTYRNIAPVIVNDGSPDNTTEVARKLMKTFPDMPIRLVEQENKGLAEARNAGIRQSPAKYILPLDSDDMLSPTYVEEAVALMTRKPHLNMVYCGIQEFGAGSSRHFLPDYLPSTLLQANCFPYASLYRRSLWERVGGYNPCNPWGIEDWHFWIKCSEKGLVPERIDKHLFLYRIHENGSMWTALKPHWHEVMAMHCTMLTHIYPLDRIIEAHGMIGNMSLQSRKRVLQKISQHPNQALPRFWNALHHERRGDIQKAMLSHLQAAELSPEDEWQPHFRLWQLNAHAGKTAAANLFKKEAIRRNPELMMIEALQKGMNSAASGS